MTKTNDKDKLSLVFKKCCPESMTKTKTNDKDKLSLSFVFVFVIGPKYGHLWGQLGRRTFSWWTILSLDIFVIGQADMDIFVITREGDGSRQTDKY
jgi:hypothetical protein